MAKVVAESFLFSKASLLKVTLPRLFDSFGPILAILLVYVGVYELAVAVVFGYPARGCGSGTRRGRAGS